MTNIWRRLRYYGIGFSIGCVFVFFFFQNRGCSWLPSNRVKNAILDRVIVVSETTEEKLEKKGITLDEVIELLNDGDVNFKLSDKDSDSKVYAIQKDNLTYFFTLPYESFISEVYLGGKSKDNHTSTVGLGSFIHFPADDNLVFPDSTSLVTCQQEKLGLIEPKKILKGIKETGTIDFSKSELLVRPKPVHYLNFVNDGDTVGMSMIWYKNKLNITSFHFDGDKECEEK